MQLERMFRKMIDVGWKAEWRDQATLEAQLVQRRAEYEALTGYEKKYYDLERLKNPFGCSRICSGAPDLDVRGMMVDINCTMSGILYAERLRERYGVSSPAYVEAMSRPHDPGLHPAHG